MIMNNELERTDRRLLTVLSKHIVTCPGFRDEITGSGLDDVIYWYCYYNYT
jgi:hypothetical protein